VAASEGAKGDQVQDTGSANAESGRESPQVTKSRPILSRTSLSSPPSLKILVYQDPSSGTLVTCCLLTSPFSPSPPASPPAVSPGVSVFATGNAIENQFISSIYRAIARPLRAD